MADIEVEIRDVVTGEAIEAELPDDQPISVLLPVITDQLGITEAGRHKLVNKSQKFEYNEDDTLGSRNTRPNDNLALSYDATFGCLDNTAKT